MSSGTILVSCSREDRAQPYLEALRAVGLSGEELRVVHPQNITAQDAVTLAASAAGVLLCGGPDIEPHHYGESSASPVAETLSLMPERDALELGLLAGAREAATPTLAICRGMQVANVFLGGTLWQDLPLQRSGEVGHNVEEPRDHLAHAVQVTAPQTELGALLVRQEAVNSRHHQAIKDLAPALELVAVAPDGVIEAVAGVDPHWWLWAVQWHPENLVALEGQRGLFASFRDRARAHLHVEARSTGAR